MTLASRALCGALGLGSLLIAMACQSKAEKQLAGLNISEEQARELLAEISGHPLAQKAPRSKPSSRSAPPPVERQKPEDAPQVLEPALVSQDWIVDGLVDIAPAAPSVAHESGIIVINAKNELLLAQLSGLASGKEPAETRLQGLSAQVGPFALGRGPSVADGYAYWITSHFLLRRPTTAPFGPLEILADDARIGTRTAILARAPQRRRADTWVAYVALPKEKNGPLRAKMWHGTNSRLLLTPPGNSALSVDLFDTGKRVFALSIEARTGSTALHARELLARPKPWTLTDQVVWVGGSAHPMTELHLVKHPRSRSAELLGLIPLDQDVTHFGLLALNFKDITQRDEPSVNWTLYKNGLDPAPVSSATLCGQSVALFARPSDPAPGSPQELILTKLVDGKPTDAIVLAHSKAFYDVSLAGLDRLPSNSAALAERGGLLSYVADYRTWGRAIRCAPPP